MLQYLKKLIKRYVACVVYGRIIMKTYKVVPFAGTLVINKKDVVQEKIVTYFDVINQECVDGWEFLTLAPVNVTVKEGGLKTKNEAYNAFIFVKDVPDGE